ncbi:MAG: DUF72 domain-containing protein [Sphingomonas sp.]|nr:MAG: DUF72 domain-containing protein [Sphingomonas sp.]
MTDPTCVIGTAGWSIPAADRPNFPETGTALQRYAAVMHGVEVNSSFHRPHRQSTWARWATSVPDDFRFAAKIPRSISHDLRLHDAAAPLDRFLDEVSGLGGKLALLLLQLPPSLAFDNATVTRFLADIGERTDTKIVCEPRHASWFEPDADSLLATQKVARVAADPARIPAAARPGGWRGLTYYRLHGSPDMYRSAYGLDRLRDYARLIAEDHAAGRPAWCMFDNTAASAALRDAVQLMELVDASSDGRAG